MTRAVTPGPLLGALRYGPSSSAGPDPASRFLEMSPAELAGLECRDFYANREVILSAKSQFSQPQLEALEARARECTGAGAGPLIPTPTEVATTVLGADGLLGGVADVVANTVLALGGVALIGLGVARIFGATPGRVAAATGPGRAARAAAGAAGL